MAIPETMNMQSMYIWNDDDDDDNDTELLLKLKEPRHFPWKVQVLFIWEPISHLVSYTMLTRPNKAETAVHGC